MKTTMEHHTFPTVVYPVKERHSIGNHIQFQMYHWRRFPQWLHSTFHNSV